MNSRRITSGLWAFLVLGLVAHSARGDGGKVRVSRRAGPYLVTVFTTPTPLRAGLADISVLVQDPKTEEIASDVNVNVLVKVADSSQPSRSYRASLGQATNKLLRAVTVQFLSSGSWTVTVIVKGPPGGGQLKFTANVLEAPPPWRKRLPWIAWPLLPIGLFALREIAEHLNSSET